jgi:hypothetical protein
MLNAGGNWFGGWAAGNPNAQGLAGQSMGLQTLATGTSALGSLFQGIGGLQEGQYGATLARQNVNAALQAGQTNESEEAIRFGQLEGRQKANQGASGVGVNSASAAAVRRSTEEVGAMDEAIIHYNAAREAYGSKVQEQQDKYAGTNQLLKGVLGAGASLIGGASSLADKWAGYKINFASNNPMTLPQAASPTTLNGEGFEPPYSGTGITTNVPSVNISG